MPFNPEIHKQVIIDRINTLPKLLELMAVEKRGQQQELDYLIAEAYKRKVKK